MKRVLLLLILSISFLISGQKSIAVDLSKQRLYAREDGKTIFSARISSGQVGRDTPPGYYKILEKDKNHVSNMYPKPNGGAKMPYMLRLSYDGIAIHQGYLPGVPASHGCIRVSRSSAKKLWKWSEIGTKVVVYGNAADFLYAKKRRVKKRSYYAKAKKSKYNGNIIIIKKYRYSKSKKHYRYAKYKRYKYKRKRYAKRYHYKRYHKKRRKRYASSGYKIVDVDDS